MAQPQWCVYSVKSGYYFACKEPPFSSFDRASSSRQHLLVKMLPMCSICKSKVEYVERLIFRSKRAVCLESVQFASSFSSP
ncbi:hypothetical protein LguiA_004938 [Lonicera macranthoides]